MIYLSLIVDTSAQLQFNINENHCFDNREKDLILIDRFFCEKLTI